MPKTKKGTKTSASSDASTDNPTAAKPKKALSSGKKKAPQGRITTDFKEGVVASLKSCQYQPKSDDSIPYSDKAVIALQQEMRAIVVEIKALEAKLKAGEETLKKPQKKQLIAEIDEKYHQVDIRLIQRVNMVSETIKHHANMRVNLFFLLCVALYKKNVDVIKGATRLQHGKGRQSKGPNITKETDDEEFDDYANNDYGTAACHASLFPTIYTRLRTIFQESGWSDFFKPAKPVHFGFLEKIYGTDKDVAKDEYHKFGTDSLIRDLFLDDTMNLTHELPGIVNTFDCQMEGTYSRSNAVKASLEILNMVSYGKINPTQSLELFLQKAMKPFFGHMEYKCVTQLAVKSLTRYPLALRQVFNLQKEGTFRICNAYSTTIKNEYFDMMMGFNHHLNEAFNGQLTTKAGAAKALSTLWSPKDSCFKAMQEDIYSSHSYRVK